MTIDYFIFLLISPYNLGVNLWAFHLIKLIATPNLNFFMALMAKSYIIIIPLLVIYLYIKKKDMNLYSFIIAFLVLYLLSDIIKLIVREPRPCNINELSWINNISCESTFGFPSNHAAVLTGLPIFLKGYKFVQILYIIWVITILFGRVYLGVHYLTDVFAGSILSIIIVYVIYKYRNRINNTINKIIMKIAPKIALKNDDF